MRLPNFKASFFIPNSGLIGSCELLGVNPRDWLNDVFSKIAGKKEYDAKALLPFNYVKK